MITRPDSAERTGTAGAAVAEAAPLSGRRRLPAWALVMARTTGIFLASRAVVFAAFWTASRLVPTVGLAETVTAWDGGWYLQTAEHGYPTTLQLVDGHVAQSHIAFFPLYPLCVRAVHTVLGVSYQAAGLLVAGLAGLVAVVLLRFLLQRLWSPEAADRGVVLFCFFPGALVLSLTYSEALMMALTIGAFLALMSRRWLVAGVLAGLATATRPNAVALVAACAWASFAAIRSDRDWRSLSAPLLAPLGFMVYQAYLWAHTGHADAWFQTQEGGWGERLAIGATWDKLSEFFRGPMVDVNITIAVAGTLFVAVTLVFLIRTRPPGPVLVYTAGIVLLALLSQTLGARPRFVLTAFPLVTVLGRWLRGTAFSVAVACSAALLGSFAVVSVVSLLATP